MKICVIGAGYVGLTTSAVLADIGHSVTCVDINEKRIEQLNEGIVPIHEEGLEEYIERNVTRGQLKFNTDLMEAASNSEIILIAVGTPQNEDGSSNLTALKTVVYSLLPSITTYKIILTKSTVPPGTNEWINNTILESGIPADRFDVVSNPEFLREGTAIYDTLNPDRIVVGVTQSRPIPYVQKLYHSINTPYVITNLTGAEMIKYASNAFLATKISFINEIARICDLYDVDITDVSLGIGLDKRIGQHFLHAGLGYGGSCLPKDVSALTSASKLKNYHPILLEGVQTINNTQPEQYIHKLFHHLPKQDKYKITVWGTAFKPNTDDTRSSPASHIIDLLNEKEVSVHVYDPVAKLNKKGITIEQDIYDSVKNSDALFIATDWPQFKKVDFEKVSKNMRGNYLVDGRNFLNPQKCMQYGFNYISIAHTPTKK